MRAAFGGLSFLGQSLHCGTEGWAALSTGAPALGATCQQNAALWFTALSFFSGTFALRSPGTPPMVDVPKVVGPDFPVQEAGAWSLGRARGMSGEHSSGCVETIHGLGKIRILGVLP